MSKMGKHIRLGRFERQQQKLAAQWRASQVSDNLQISLNDVVRQSITPAIMSIEHLQSKGARGGGSPFGRTERFERKTAATPKRFGQR